MAKHTVETLSLLDSPVILVFAELNCVSKFRDPQRVVGRMQGLAI